jgi:catechol 2,3-dioxygenase-like lactoylglutathione lyase family enzyme
VIQHVALEVRPRDGDACARVWELLGFEAVAAPRSLEARTAWLQRGGTQIHLLFAEAPVVAPAGHVAVVVDAYDATLAALRGAGLEPDPRPEHWGSPRCFVRCPAGHRVEIMAFAPDAAAPG